MPATRVAVFVGSLRKGSINRQLARALEQIAPGDFAFDHADIGALPLYDQDFDADYPPACAALKRTVEGADALLFVTPEYNRSIPGVLKNALDVASRPWGRNSFAGKPAGIVGMSPGATGTALAQQHLRNVLAHLDVPVLCQPEMFLKHEDGMFEAGGGFASERTRKFVQGWMDRYVAWVARHR